MTTTVVYLHQSMFSSSRPVSLAAWSQLQVYSVVALHDILLRYVCALYTFMTPAYSCLFFTISISLSCTFRFISCVKVACSILCIIALLLQLSVHNSVGTTKNAATSYSTNYSRLQGMKVILIFSLITCLERVGKKVQTRDGTGNSI